MSWNPALDLYCEIKNEYINCFGEETLWSYHHNETNCLAYWVKKLIVVTSLPFSEERARRKFYKDFVNCLDINEYGNYILLKYKSFSDLYVNFNPNSFWVTPLGEIMRECRSLVINTTYDEIVLSPFRKFFNVNELVETNEDHIRYLLEWAEYVEISDKLDGAMQSYRWYDNHIVGSGSQALDREQSWRLEKGYCYVQEYDDMLQDYPDWTFIFELIDPDNNLVVQYDKKDYGLHLIGIRDSTTGVEHSYAHIQWIAKKYNVPVVTMNHKLSFDDIMSNRDAKKANEAEGFVLNIDGKMKVKIKYSDYIMIHKAIGKFTSPKAIIEAIKEDRFDDFYSMIPPAYRKEVDEIAENVKLYLKVQKETTEKYYDMVMNGLHPQTKKDFMIAVYYHVPDDYQGWVRNIYLGQDTDYLRGRKYQDIVEFLLDELS